MRLRKLILHGFKSFADRTEFAFDMPVTCIVGPNGCGKSNVVDAVKWVLGEQSAKSLRGDAMLDVVFNGSGTRKPAGMAEVVLVFENPANADGVRVLNLPSDDVAVGRRLYRDGTSEYTLNGQSARLKDIRDLFLDTGVGVDAYSVIEQGRVAQLLESNPLQRRVIFEEAAGISRFKVKKKEAQRKLEKVDQNLLRVNDTVQSVDRQLRSVKIAAGKARNYQELATRLSELRFSHALQDYHMLFNQLNGVVAEMEETQFRVDDISGDLAKRTQELEQAREEAETSAQAKQRSEHELVETQSAVRSAQQKGVYAKEQLRQIAEQIESIGRDQKAASERRESIDQQLQAEKVTLEELTQLAASGRDEIEQKQAAHKADQLRLNELLNSIEKNKQAVLDLMRRASQVNSRLASIEIERRNTAMHEKRQTDRRDQVNGEVAAAESLAVQLQTKIDEIKQQHAERQQQHDARRASAAELGQQIKQLTDQLGSAKEHRSGLLSRQKLLQDLEARREGVSDAVKKVLKEREVKYPFVKGLVADLLRVDVEHAKAIEAALDGRDQYLVVESAEAVTAEAIQPLTGRVSFLPASDVPPQGSPSPYPLPAYRERERGPLLAGGGAFDWSRVSIGLRFAADLVRCEPEHAEIVVALLGTTAVVDTLQDAFCLHNFGPAGWRYVTPDGYAVEANGAIKAGPMGASMGLLSRRSELDAIALQIADVDASIATFSETVAHTSQQARQAEEEINQLRNAVYQLNTQRVEHQSKHQQATDRINSLRRELPLLDRELANLQQQTQKLDVEEAEKKTIKDELDGQQAGAQQAIDDHTAQQRVLTEEVRKLNDDLTAARVAHGQVEQKQISSRQSVERLSAQLNEAGQQIERLAKSVESVASRQGASEAAVQQAAHDEGVAQAKVADLKERVSRLQLRVAELSEIVKASASKVESVRGLHGEIEHKLSALAVQKGELTVRLEALVARTTDELQIDLPARYTEATEAEGGYAPGDVNWEEIATEIKELKDKIQRLGNVNLDSIGELDELEQKQTFFATQLADLQQAKQQLEQLIDEINQESGVRFEQTFKIVREHFQTLFRNLFGGGSADIVLELEVEDREAMKAAAAELGEGGGKVPVMRKTVDPLDAGIEIIAKPPGKKPVSISQLSGGEKAMTCIALLMSIFKSKPSPFCILDEVDAPLDEANNVRFGMIVQEFLSLSQFIIITHHKRTMQIADVMYGVTQQEQGVSRRVAVKFDQVQQGGRISDAAFKAAEREQLAESAA